MVQYKYLTDYDLKRPLHNGRCVKPSIFCSGCTKKDQEICKKTVLFANKQRIERAQELIDYINSNY
jgi:hypothetical protein